MLFAISGIDPYLVALEFILGWITGNLLCMAPFPLSNTTKYNIAEVHPRISKGIISISSFNVSQVKRLV
jgi:hypothetical protein